MVGALGITGALLRTRKLISYLVLCGVYCFLALFSQTMIVSSIDHPSYTNICRWERRLVVGIPQGAIGRVQSLTALSLTGDLNSIEDTS